MYQLLSTSCCSRWLTIFLLVPDAQHDADMASARRTNRTYPPQPCVDRYRSYRRPAFHLCARPWSYLVAIATNYIAIAWNAFFVGLEKEAGSPYRLFLSTSLIRKGRVHLEHGHIDIQSSKLGSATPLLRRCLQTSFFR